ncbi:putative cytochrome P450 hydroxylase [Enhygromyxa salina]|uniref:Putative cytochrome P450 hydroxylase n=1 Tax=Enhygromyxa salina TaxID=215803 RepID=A0A0C2D6U3_9BACT|nr:cytochrome P450 [Enhygromyxa salina]KIG17365.1 putative cytochrome P450 hydroxylase [Enhygromyxa salina]
MATAELRGAHTFNFDPFNAHRDDPHTPLRKARREHPVFFSPALGTWVITRHADVVAALRDPARFSSANAITNVPAAPPPEILEVLAAGIPYEPNSVDLDPPRHTKFRALINQAFTPRRIHAKQPTITALAHAAIEGFAHAGTADLVAEFAYPLPARVIADLLGIPSEDLPAFKRWSDEWLVMIGQIGDLDRQRKAAAAVVEFQHYIAAMIAARRTRPSEGLVSDVVAAVQDMPDPPSDNALVGLLMTVLFAGHETTTSLITNTIKLLLQHPEALAQVRADAELIPAAITETLRFDPPVPNMYRTTTADVRVGGVDLPAGEHLRLSFASANRDAACFADPDRFDLHRADKANHLAFGQGIHACVGAALAQLEARVSVQALLERLPGLRLVEGALIEPVVSATVRGTRRLMLAWDRQ